MPVSRLLRPLALAACAALVVERPAPAQTQPPATGVVSGRVQDAVTQAPLADVQVRVVGQDAQGRSDAEGAFTITGVRPGVVRLEARRLGYVPLLRGNVAVSAGKPVVVTLAMTRAQVQLREVTVRPEAFPVLPPATTPVSTTSLTFEELRRTPGASEDVLQALSVAPGVATTTAGRNDLFVRGGAAWENLFVVDNLEVPNINHFGTLGSTGGPLSLLNIRFIEQASLSAGGFGVRYGDRLSSSTVITLRDGNRERMAGELNLAASQYGALVEGPIGSRASFFANVRQSYLDLLFSALGASFIPRYTDATFKATWRPTRRDVVSALAVGAVDRVRFVNDSADQRVDNSQILAPEQDQYFAGLTWKRLFGAGVATTTLGRTWTRYRTAQFDSLQPPNPVFEAATEEAEHTLRTDVTWQLSPRLTLDAGNALRHAPVLRYDVTIPGALRRDAGGAPRPLRIDTTFSAWRNATYVQGAWQARARLRLVAGVRADAYGFLDDRLALSPRASATLQLSERTALTASLGRYHQPPPFTWLAGDPGNRASLRALRADQLVLGVQRRLGDDWRVQLEGYVKGYPRYAGRTWRPNAVLQPSGFENAFADIPFGLEPLRSDASGTVVGWELQLQKVLGAVPVYALASVSVNRARFTALDGSRARGAFDVPVVANAVVGWRPGARWELSGRARSSSGVPVTPFVTTGPRAGSLDFARYNAERLPYFLSVDARVDRRWAVRGTQFVTFVDVQNANARLNVTGLDWDPRTRTVRQGTGLRVLPTIGLNWEF